MIVSTVGHGTLPQEDFVVLAHGAELAEVVDIRSFPHSRRNPQYDTEEMSRWLTEADLGYVWMQNLGGRRRAKPDSKHIALRHPSFRAYADYMETEPFLTGVDNLLAQGDDRAVMCSESVWWRCHRRLLADHLVLVREVQVRHLMHDGRLAPHRPTEGVRRQGHRLIYDVGATPAVPDSG